MPSETDVVVIGGGPVGENAAQYAVEGGLEVVLIEEALLGGECSYYACMPSKALLRPVEVADLTHNLTGVSEAAVAPAELLARRDSWVSQYDDAGQAEWAESVGIPLARGHGRITGEREVTVAGRGVVRARKAVVLATGSRPVIADGFAPVEPWTSRDATGVVEIPKSIIIVGGGVVAVEAATWLSALGSRVTMLVRNGLLGRFEDGVAEHVAEGLGAAGVTVMLDAPVGGVDRQDPRATGLGLIHGGAVQVVSSGSHFEADEILVATGRRPNLDSVGLDAIGLTPDDVAAGRLPEWLVAIGDCGPGAPLTHMGKHEARVLGSRLAAAPSSSPAALPSPRWCSRRRRWPRWE